MIKQIVLFCVYVIYTSAQDCKFYGRLCADHEQCCGGCCFDGICIDTYRSCQASLGVCDDHICRGEENCYIYVPPQCAGCEPLPLCR